MMKFYKYIVAVIAIVMVNYATTAQSTTQKVDGNFTFVNPIPLPLGRYVQLADSTATFTVEKYYASEKPFKITYISKFKIIRHVPKIDFLSYHGESLAENSWLKFKKDQNAVEILSEAIADTQANEVCVPWSRVYNGNIEDICQKFNQKQFKFIDSSIYRRVPQSNVQFVDTPSNTIFLTEPACLSFYSEDGLSRLNFSLTIFHSDINQEFRTFAKVRTASGSYEITLKGGLVVLNHGSVYRADHLTPRDMDKLLSEDIVITVYPQK